MVPEVPGSIPGRSPMEILLLDNTVKRWFGTHVKLSVHFPCLKRIPAQALGILGPVRKGIRKKMLLRSPPWQERSGRVNNVFEKSNEQYIQGDSKTNRKISGNGLTL